MKRFIHFTQPLFGKEEKQEILAALDSGWVTLGPRTKQFEEDFAEYVGAKHAIAVSSCTAGLHIGLLAAGIGKGDEVITTPFTFAATANTIVQVGATPIFVDIDEKTFNIDPAKIEEKITKNTKAIVPVHYGGLAADLDAIQKIAKKHNLVLIEDGAHAAGSVYKKNKIGNVGDMTVFSFHPIKNMSTGDGGMVTTNNDDFAASLMKLRLHGMSKDAWKRHTVSGSWRYDVEIPGFKYNMTDLSAALGIHQLRKLNGFIEKRREYAKMFDEAFIDVPEITTPYIPKGQEHIYTLYTIKIDTKALKIGRDEIVEELKKANIGANVQFIPLQYLTYYKNTYGYKEGDFPVSEDVFEQIISLPLYPGMSEKEVRYVIDSLTHILVSNRQEYVWAHDPFDTKIFGMDIVKIKQISSGGGVKNIQKRIVALQKEMKEKNVDYAVYRTSTENYPLIQVLEDNNFVMVDGLVSLQANLEEEEYLFDGHIREAKKKDLQQLKDIASTAFDRTRLYNDKLLDRKKAGELYSQWIENSLNKEAADEVFVWEEENEILGFVTLQKNGHIPLIAVRQKARGNGIAKALVKAGLFSLKKLGVKDSEIETQIANIPALRVYQSCGFKIVDSHLTFRWADK
jgi:dTDP-4-amino-4,6-dideoxygalactose transaminase/ribosomal protein S18 acetylase RimI-like enzyme